MDLNLGITVDKLTRAIEIYEREDDRALDYKAFLECADIELSFQDLNKTILHNSFVIGLPNWFTLDSGGNVYVFESYKDKDGKDFQGCRYANTTSEMKAAFQRCMGDLWRIYMTRYLGTELPKLNMKPADPKAGPCLVEPELKDIEFIVSFALKLAQVHDVKEMRSAYVAERARQTPTSLPRDQRHTEAPIHEEEEDEESERMYKKALEEIKKTLIDMKVDEDVIHAMTSGEISSALSRAQIKGMFHVLRYVPKSK